jgi:hypothetical protein
MARGRPLEAEQEVVEAFKQSGLVSEYLASILPADVWRATPPGRGRSIAAIVAHMQSVRRTFARMGGGAPIDTRSSPASAEAEGRVAAHFAV